MAAESNINNNSDDSNTKFYEFLVTFFPDAYARTKTQKIINIDELVEVIINTQGAEKRKLPFLKFAQFGDVRTEHGCLRNDGNIIAISGSMGDYDEEQMSFEEAIERVKAEGICALLYTSPSHTPDKPRWRIIAPYSKLIGPELYTLMMNRLNGICGGTLAPESWALSQGFYYGYTPQSDAHYRVEWVEGDFIDLREDLPLLEKAGRQKQTNPDTLVQRLGRLSKKWQDLIVSGDANEYNGDKSRLTAAAVRVMASEGFPKEEIKQVLLNPAYGISQHCLSENSPERAVERVTDFISKPEPIIEELNKNHAFIIVGGKSSVLREIINEKGLSDFKFINVEAFHNFYASKNIRVGDKRILATKYWLKSPQRRTYEGIAFAPEGTSSNYYNTWQGFGVEPSNVGSCQKFLAHLRDNVCSGDEDLYRWVEMWFAHIFQYPAGKIGTSLVLRGKQGVGKTKVAEVFGALLKTHYTHVRSPREITGQFNGHLIRTILLFADEAFWGGDKKSEGILKDLVTSLRLRVEYKGKEPFEVDNYIRLLVSSNSEWVVPAGMEERRFCILDVGEEQMQNFTYFAAIDEELENGGCEALLHHMLNVQIDTSYIRKIPTTAALLDQKLEGLLPHHAWWSDLLAHGVLPGSNEEDPATCPTRELYDNYLEYAKSRHAWKASSEIKLGFDLRKLMPIGFLLNRQRRRYNGVSRYHYTFPPLRDCRAFFTIRMQQSLGWDMDAEWSPDHVEEGNNNEYNGSYSNLEHSF